MPNATADRSQGGSVVHHLCSDELQVLEVRQIQDLQVHAGGAQAGVGGQFGQNLVGTATEPVLTEFVDLVPDGGGSAFDVRLVAAAAQYLGGRVDER